MYINEFARFARLEPGKVAWRCFLFDYYLFLLLLLLVALHQITINNIEIDVHIFTISFINIFRFEPPLIIHHGKKRRSWKKIQIHWHLSQYFQSVNFFFPTQITNRMLHVSNIFKKKKKFDKPISAQNFSFWFDAQVTFNWYILFFCLFARVMLICIWIENPQTRTQ